MVLRRRRQPSTDGVVVDAVPIGSAPPRTRTRVCGAVVAIRVRPARGLPALVVTIEDETGRAVAVWSGRRSIGGVVLGRRLVLEGVGVRAPEGLTFLNPGYELLP
jgi:hypothetical protein